MPRREFIIVLVVGVPKTKVCRRVLIVVVKQSACQPQHPPPRRDLADCLAASRSGQRLTGHESDSAPLHKIVIPLVSIRGQFWQMAIRAVWCAIVRVCQTTTWLGFGLGSLFTSDFNSSLASGRYGHKTHVGGEKDGRSSVPPDASRSRLRLMGVAWIVT